MMSDHNNAIRRECIRMEHELADAAAHAYRNRREWVGSVAYRYAAKMRALAWMRGDMSSVPGLIGENGYGPACRMAIEDCYGVTLKGSVAA